MLEPQIKILWSKLYAGDAPTITPVHQHNHVYRVHTVETDSYLKIFTKDWYGDDISGTGFCVDHEASAWRALATVGLHVPEILMADTTCDNPLERPYLLTRALRGRPLTDLLAENVDDSTQFTAIVRAAGDYLRVMHSIRFDYPGYISSRPLVAPPEPDAWRHAIWTFESWKQKAEGIWNADRHTLDLSLMDAIDSFYAAHAADLETAYSPPHFTHGDCHAHQFFLEATSDGWVVTGVLDMEVASAGDSGADFMQFNLEISARCPVESRWWEALFAGYGQEPDFDLIKLRMLAVDPASYGWIWPGERARILAHVLNADDWASLYDPLGKFLPSSTKQ